MSAKICQEGKSNATITSMKILALGLFLISLASFLFIFNTKFPLQKPTLAQACQNGDGICPQGCLPENDNDCTDTKDYWQFEPGNYWELRSPDGSYGVRIDIEEEQTLCQGTPNEIVAVPFRATQTQGVPASWSGRSDHDFRWYVSKNFDKKPGWESETRWARLTKFYRPRSEKDNPFSDLDHFDQTNNYKSAMFLSPDESRFPPYFTTPRYLDVDNDISHLGFHKLGFEYPSFDCNKTWDKPDDGWKVAYKKVNVTTPAYTGPALRIRFWEYGIPSGYSMESNPEEALLNATAVNFDEWYLAKGIGIVKINNKIKRGERCGDDADCRGETETMQAPTVTMNLVNYYHVGEPFNISVTPTVVQPGGTYTVNLGESYNGYVEVKGEYESLDGQITPIERHRWGSSAGEKTIGDFWFTNGKFSVKLPQDAGLGTYKVKLRPFIIGKNNSLAESNNLPWSNEVAVVVMDIKTLLQNWGDVFLLPQADINSDGLVNGIDFGKLLRLIQ